MYNNVHGTGNRQTAMIVTYYLIISVGFQGIKALINSI